MVEISQGICQFVAPESLFRLHAQLPRLLATLLSLDLLFHIAQQFISSRILPVDP